MKKNKKWLKEQLSYLQDGVGESFNDYSKGLNIAYNTLELLINQLEEPEQEKLVINEEMAGHIENCKNLKLTLSDSLHLVVPGDKRKEMLFARAWLDGYSVEKEKLYKVELPIDRLHHILTIHADGSGHFFGKEHTNNSWYRTHLTEQEIKNIDERYWAFAEELTK